MRTQKRLLKLNSNQLNFFWKTRDGSEIDLPGRWMPSRYMLRLRTDHGSIVAICGMANLKMKIHQGMEIHSGAGSVGENKNTERSLSDTWRASSGPPMAIILYLYSVPYTFTICTGLVWWWLWMVLSTGNQPLFIHVRRTLLESLFIFMVRSGSYKWIWTHEANPYVFTMTPSLGGATPLTYIRPARWWLFPCRLPQNSASGI